MDDPLSTRRQALAANEAEKFVLIRQEQIIAEIVSRYRAGKTEHDWLIGMVAELSAGKRLITEMQRAISQGD